MDNAKHITPRFDPPKAESDRNGSWTGRVSTTPTDADLYIQDKIKKLGDELASKIYRTCPEGPLTNKAILDVQSAVMFAVKSLYYR